MNIYYSSLDIWFDILSPLIKQKLMDLGITCGIDIFNLYQNNEANLKKWLQSFLNPTETKRILNYCEKTKNTKKRKGRYVPSDFIARPKG